MDGSCVVVVVVVYAVVAGLALVEAWTLRAVVEAET